VLTGDIRNQVDLLGKIASAGQNGQFRTPRHAIGLMVGFKSFTAGQIVKRLTERHSPVLELLAFHKARHKTDREHQVWQEGSHPEQVEGEAMMLQKLEYIHNNPVARGYVDDPLHWRYSSARNYAGQAGLIEVATQW
jgi:putative transposase